MLIVTFDLNNINRQAAILSQIRRYKNVRLSPSAYALDTKQDVHEVENWFRGKLLSGERVWIISADGPFCEVEPDKSNAALLH